MMSENRIAITGITGFVGRGLPPLLAKRGFSITGVSRAGKGNVPGVDRWMTPESLDLSDHRAVIHLAGEPVARRWTAEAKRSFRESRVDFTRTIVDAISRLPEGHRPDVLVNASAVGFYGDRGDEILTESAGAGQGYLAELCRDWERRRSWRRMWG
jgi:NAD dependent epimerase/dehydratase family enzyme